MKALTSQQKVVCNQTVYRELVGLDIPELPDDATDDEIFAALANLTEAGDKLFTKRKALAKDAEKIIASLGQEIADEEAIKKSSRIKDSLKETNKSITSSIRIGDI